MVSGTDELQDGLESCRNEEAEIEFWFARDLQNFLGYSRWEAFENVIEKAAENCASVGLAVDDHFRQVTKMVKIGSGAERSVTDYILSRYGSYLVAINADSAKPNVAYIKHYFVVQTRDQEVVEQRVLDAERVESRLQLKVTEKALSSLFFERGLDGAQIASVRSKGDKQLFGGQTTKAMKDKYGISASRALADFLPTLTIAAKTLVNEMTKLNVEAEDIRGERGLTAEHVENSRSVRGMLGSRGIKPEELPAGEDVIKVERRLAKEERSISTRTLGEIDS